jgi:hypothetical protein
MFSEYVDARASMHEVYKAWRADDMASMNADFARSVGPISRMDLPHASYREACQRGQLTIARTEQNKLVASVQHLAASVNTAVFNQVQTMLRWGICDAIINNHIDVLAMALNEGHGARFPTEIYTRGCHWIPRMFA